MHLASWELPSRWRGLVFLGFVLATSGLFWIDWVVTPVGIMGIMPYVLLIVLVTLVVGNGTGLALSLLSITFWGLAETRLFAQVSPSFGANLLINSTFLLVVYGLLFRYRQMHAMVRDLSYRDDLAGIYNRRGFLLMAEKILAVNRRRGATTTLVFLDVDHFKAVNDTRGHREGDRVIQAIGSVLAQETRDSDVVGRVGGDEFCVLFADGSDVDPVVDRIRERFRERSSARGWPTTLSVGTATAHDGETMESLLARADTLMYEAKRRSRNPASNSFRPPNAP